MECLQLNPVPLSPQYFITFIILLAIKYCFKDRGGADVLRFPAVVTFFYLPRTKQLCLHLTNQPRNVKFAVMDAIQKDAMSLDYYLLGLQYVTHWLHFRVPVYELKACCA